MLIPYSDNQESFSYKMYKNNSDKMNNKNNNKILGGLNNLKKENKLIGANSNNCEIWNETTISRLKEVDFTCFADDETNKVFNKILNFIYDNIIVYQQDPDNAMKYKNMINEINNSARILASNGCNANVFKDPDAVNQLSSMMCNYLFVEHVKDLYYMPKNIINMQENYKNIEFYSKVGVMVDGIAICAGLVFIVMLFSKL